MQNQIFSFCCDESGAVTVDWVVLTAAVVGLAYVVLLPIAFTTGNSATAVANQVSDAPVGYGAAP